MLRQKTLYGFQTYPLCGQGPACTDPDENAMQGDLPEEEMESWTTKISEPCVQQEVSFQQSRVRWKFIGFTIQGLKRQRAFCSNEEL